MIKRTREMWGSGLAVATEDRMTREEIREAQLTREYGTQTVHAVTGSV